MTLSLFKKLNARKSLCLFTYILDVKPKIEKRRFVAEKTKLKAMKVGNILWNKNIKRKGHSKFNEQMKLNIYA